MEITHKTDMRMQVDVSAVAKSASAILAMFCITSLIFGTISRFQMIHPFVATLVIMASACFYLMGVIISRRSKRER